MRRLYLDGAYTLQLVINGQADVVGSYERAVRAGIVRAEARPKTAISLRAERPAPEVKVSLEVGDSMRQADLYLALANDYAQSQVTRGENSGRTLRRVAVVSSLVRVGTLHAAWHVRQGTDASVGMRIPSPGGLWRSSRTPDRGRF